ncbi:hypothetical protein N7517_008853 [Penicillium concentricum]|uniref:PH domain-containing protein n=1 Tax=Penicillium concentricum TaxID=293559 RepID=A0A9W9V222_9EURO|nr:uncharacterized protein N7517_008853 [Penicillium concentricum]KAJ5365967.1 hypothetical protein N7517_008853 [Penicillium concentricum]
MSENTTAQSVTRKFSRYRARSATTGDVEMPPPAPVASVEQNPSIARSRSRYRRNRPTSNGNDAPPTPAIPGHARTQLEQRSERESERAAASRPLATQNEEDACTRELHRQGAMEQLTGGDNSAQNTRQPQASVLPKQVAQLPRSQPAPAQPPAHPPRSAHSENDSHRKSFFQKVKLSRSKDHVKKTDPLPNYIGVGGTGVVPGLDAPVSAVNAGERYALVKYGDATADLTVTPSTQVRDILLDATKHLSRDIDAEKFILMESYSQVGLERPLRRYEHVREVMNSWSHDADNHVDALTQLDAGHAPNGQPSPVTVHIYHSQRRRKWDKRYVTLRSDGQVTVSKKENAQDQTKICHISDYDIYFPSARALNKDIKPPKKLCFAIKSQQKSSMFLSTENFLHFFSTSDKSIADTWYRAVQKWRSWYLVNKKGAGQKPETETPKRAGTKRSTNQPRNVYNEVPLLKRETSTEFTKGDSSDQQRPTSSKDIFTRKKTLRGHVPPPSSYQPLTLDTDMDGPFTDKHALISGISPEEVETSTFAPSGLLGRSYTQRQTAMRERDDRDKRAKQEAFTGTGFMSGGSTHAPGYDSNPNSRTNTMTRAPDSSQFNRTPSLNQKPLIDLTPVYAEPPQHSRKGKGHGVKVQPGMHLIDGATGPDQTPGVIAIPPSTSWRRPAAPAETIPQRRNTTRSVRHHPNTYAPPISAEGSPALPAQFTPHSLLAHSASTTSHRNPRTGHGVATGDRNATRPLLDMSPENPFADGSLLRQL